MKCLLCETLSLIHICQECQREFLTPSIYKRQIAPDLTVISFYKYDHIKELLHTKHTPLGYYIYSILAQNSIAKFAKEFVYEESLVSIGVDDVVSSGYSHTAILNKTLKSKIIKPLFGRLRAKNRVSYAGKTREFRLLNPRDFQIKPFKEDEVVLVDDIITTGHTLQQASAVLASAGKRVHFCLTLADASQKDV